MPIKIPFHGEIKPLITFNCGLLFFIFVLFVPTILDALDSSKDLSQYTIDKWQTGDGLPQNSVHCITQDSKGYLWLGTQEGLVQFDGLRFQIFDKRRNEGLPANHIECLVSMANGSLWIGTNKGLSVYQNGRFTLVDETVGFGRYSILSLTVDKDQHLWIGTDGHGLFHFDGSRFHTITFPDEIAADIILSLLYDIHHNQLICTTAGGGVLYLDGETGRFIESIPALKDYYIRVSILDRHRNVWFGTAEEGVYCKSSGTMKQYKLADGLLDQTVTALLEDKHGNIWVGTYDGLNRIHDQTIENFQGHDALTHDLIHSLWEDHEGNLWIGTSGTGLNRIRDSLITTYSEETGLSHNDVYSMFEDSNENLWIATSHGGLNKYSDGNFIVYNAKSGLSDVIFSVYGDHLGRIWASTEDGLRIIDGTKTISFARDLLLPNLTIISLYEDSKNRMWIGTETDGVYYYDGSLFHHLKVSEGLAGVSIVAITEDSSGTIWLGSDGYGVTLFSDNKIQRVYTRKDGLSSDSIMDIFEDSMKNIWIASYQGGLTLYRNGRFSQFTMKDGLFDDVAFKILEDEQHNLWMSCNKGIYSVPVSDLLHYKRGVSEKLTCKSYGRFNGMKSHECNGGVQPAGWKCKNGDLWFPTIEGAVRLNPKEIKINTIPPPVIIEKVSINGVTLQENADIEAPIGRGEIEFHYTGLSYSAPERVQFTYILENFDKDWIQAGTRRIAYYTNVPPGKYTFRVKAANNDNIWNEQGDSVTLKLNAPVTQTVLFKITVTFISILALGIFTKSRIRKYERHQEKLAQIVHERTKDLREAQIHLEKANEELERISSRDGLTGIGNRRLLDQFYDAEWRRSIRLKTFLTVILIDIDFFKNYNDTYGHQKGDECLVMVAAEMARNFIKPGQMIARYGGEEFAVVLFNTNPEGAKDIAIHLRKSVKSLKIRHESSSISDHVTISMGVASAVPMIGMSKEILFEKADIALYNAKRHGRDCFVSMTIDAEQRTADTDES